VSEPTAEERDGARAAGRGDDQDEGRDDTDGHWDPRGPRGRHRAMSRHGRSGWHGHWARTPYTRPVWWPKDEPWPPRDEFPLSRLRRSFFIRFAIGVTLVFVLVVVGPIILIGQLLAATGLPAPGSGILAVVIVIGVIAALSRTASSARRFALPFGDLIEAAGRVEAGDYSARVVSPERGMRELRWLVQAFNSMAARLETDERQRRTLLADVSHELRTPLAVLRGELEAMIDGIHPVDEAHLAAAVEQVSMVTQLVEDLRTLALAEAGTLALHREPTDLAVLAQEAATSFEGLAASAGVRLEVEVASDVPLVDVDPLRIRQVATNLIANALHYAPPGSGVSIVAVPRPGAVAVSIVDMGPGIAPDVLPHLFERFARSADSRGSGLGLAIARRLVEAHGGTIRAESPPDGGTTVTFELPTQPEDK
jgi:signal transduction histidine kinase